jgi:hypothetical protein
MTPAEARALLPHDVAARIAEQARRTEVTAEQLDDLGRLFGPGRAMTPSEERRARGGAEACVATGAVTATVSPLSDVIRRVIDALRSAQAAGGSARQVGPTRR